MSNYDQIAEVSADNLSAGELMPFGYKTFEVGIIPDDWVSCELGEALTLQRGFDLPQRLRNEGSVPIISSAGLSGWHNVPKVLAPGIVTGRYGTIGEVFYIETNFWPLNTTLYVREFFSLDPLYIYFLLKTVDFKSHSGKSGVPGVNRNDVHQERILLPPIHEQTAIANALSDVDELITSLIKLLAKKKVIKTATMQQLLTGKTRLPAFAFREDGTRKGYKDSELGEIPEDWEVSGFGELFETTIERGSLKSSDKVTFVGMQDVSENAQINSYQMMEYRRVKSGFAYFEKGDVLVAKITPCFENGKGCFTDRLPTEIGFGSTEFHVLRARCEVSAKYIYYLTVMDSFRKSLASEMVGSAGHKRVPFSAIQNYRIALVRNAKEQMAIATILSDMDNEIKVLKKRLSKSHYIKKGMMQELLTGKTRLLKPKRSTVDE